MSVSETGSATIVSTRGDCSGWKGAISAVGALAFVLIACSGPTDPPSPPAGGQTLELDYDLFLGSVLPVLTEHGCNAAGDCHGGGIRGSFELSPAAVDPRFDFDQATLQVLPSQREASPLLTEPLALAAGGTPHSFKPFATREDPGFVAIRSWIDAGDLR